MKYPPKFVEEGGYENWKKDIEIWCKLTNLAKEKQALAIHLSLDGRARIATSELEVSALEAEDGVKTILEKLDGLFLADKGRRQFAVFKDLYNLRRPSEMTVRKFVSEFEHSYFKFSKQDMTLPDSVMAFMLLAACKLSEQEQQLVMSALSEVTYKDMKAALNRIFDGGMSMVTQYSKPVGEIKVEPIFLGGEEESEVEKSDQALYVRGPQRGRMMTWGGSMRGRGRSVTGVSRRYQRSSMRKQNPPGPDGQVSRCMICDSRFHWARNCPDAYENSGGQRITSEGTRRGGSEGNDETVHLSLFLGYAGDGDKASKLRGLVSEARGCAVLDSGCSTTVCGIGWYNDFVSNLSEHEKETIVEEPSASTFTFADGMTVRSLKKVTLPCNIGGFNATVTSDVVECVIPLLLSKRSMKKAEMVIDFKADQVDIHGVVIDVGTSASGHYLLPISA